MTNTFQQPFHNSLPSAPPFPAKLQVEVTTRCNMRCAMCVKSAPESDIPEADLNLETFKGLGPALAHCEALVLNGIGEPLLHADLTEMAAFARGVMPEQGWIGFQTNGLLITEKLADQLVGAGVDTFCISMDSLESSTSAEGELHGQASVSRLSTSFKWLRAAGDRLGRTLRLGVEFVLMRDTAEQLPRVVHWAAEHGAQFVVVSHVLAYDQTMQAQSLFNPNTPAATSLFEQWQAKALAMGLSLHDRLVWKHIKSDRLYKLIKGLQDEATKQGIWIHLSHLLEWDRRNRNGAEETLLTYYREAQSIADHAGIELRLPPLKARDERHCHFVEDSVAFVTSQGDVSPCQFLWHKYSCHMDGGEKVIKPWLFGNIREQSLVDIWRGASYVGFRNKVLDYDYPYCSNCPFVPCDDIVGKVGDFECDCLGVTIPCGHCLWCMGGLQCLL